MNNDYGAPECDDQLAVFSKTGRGLPGNGYKVGIKNTGSGETYLEGYRYDPNTKEYVSEWLSGNVNGGIINYQYHLRSHTNPPTFTITFKYSKPSTPEAEWCWTTPAIPYVVLDEEEEDEESAPSPITLSEVTAFFLKKTTEENWNIPSVTESEYANNEMTPQKHDKVIYKDGFTREDLNAPDPGKAGSVSLQYGINGDIDTPNMDEWESILGLTDASIAGLANGTEALNWSFNSSETPVTALNLRDYIDGIAGKLRDKINSLEQYGSAAVEALYPVGATYVDADNMDPNNFLPGTWELQSWDRYLKASSIAGQTGGSASHPITLPAHTHQLNLAKNYWAAMEEQTGAAQKAAKNGCIASTGPGFTGRIAIETESNTHQIRSKSEGSSNPSIAIDPQFITVRIWIRVS